MAYPSGLKLYIDGKDATYYVFGANTINPSSDLNIWRNINITPFLRKSSGLHTIEITAANGNGRVECRVEIRQKYAHYHPILIEKNHNKWAARIMKDGKRYYLGNFNTAEEAYEVYQKALQEIR